MIMVINDIWFSIFIQIDKLNNYQNVNINLIMSEIITD